MAGEVGEEAADAFEGGVGVVRGVDGEEFYEDVVFHEAGAGVADAIGEGAAALGGLASWKSV